MAARVSKMPAAPDCSTTGTTTVLEPVVPFTRRQAPQAADPRKLVASTPAAWVGTAVPAMLQAVLPPVFGVRIRAATLVACQAAAQAPPSGRGASLLPSLAPSAETVSPGFASIAGASCRPRSTPAPDDPVSAPP